MYKNKECKYLAITVHDNDFITELRLTAECIVSLPIIDLSKVSSSSSEDMDKIALSIQHILFGVYTGLGVFDKYHNNNTGVEKFKPDIKVIDFFDIPDDDNRQSVYIPLFNNKEYLVR